MKDIKLAHMRLFPGLDIEALKHTLETYDSGNAPNNQPGFLSVLEKAIKNNSVIVNCTQC